MHESPIFIPAKKRLIFITAGGAILPIFTLPIFVVLVISHFGWMIGGIALFLFLLYTVHSVLTLAKLFHKKMGLYLTNHHLEDKSNVYRGFKVRLKNIEFTELKKINGNEMLVVYLKDKKEFMQSIPFFNRLYYWINTRFNGSPTIILNTIQKQLTETKDLIDKRLGNNDSYLR